MEGDKQDMFDLPRAGARPKKEAANIREKAVDRWEALGFVEAYTCLGAGAACTPVG